MQAKEQAIGIFDSGIGGLSVLKHIHAHLPNERLMYVADSAFMPYGCKSAQIVEQRCMHIAAFFAQQNCKALVLACNTATAASVHLLRKKYAFPVIGMEPAVKPAVAYSPTGLIGVLATSGTASSEKFRQLKQRFGADVQFIVQPCPGLVELIEQGQLDSLLMHQLLRSFLQPLLQQGIDTLVLGCTHYPFVLPLVREIVGEHIRIVDSGEAIARELERQLTLTQVLLKQVSGEASGQVQFWSSGDVCEVEPLISRLWGDPVALTKLDEVVERRSV